MKNIDLALCDQDTGYITMLASYLMEHCNGLDINIFTTPESFFADSKDYHLAVMTDEFMEVSSFKQSGSIAKKYVLTEVDDEMENAICKYQSVEEILRAIPEFDQAGNICITSTEKTGNSNIIGVYSPISHELQLPFTMAVASSYKDFGKVLFLDLEELSILPSLISMETDSNLSDLLYEVSTCDEVDIKKYTHQFMGFDYVNPFMGPDEIGQIDEKTWIKFLKTVKEGSYDTVVVLFGTAIRGFSDVLQIMDKLYVLGKPGDYFRKGQEAFDDYIRKIKSDVCRENVILPMSAANLSEGTYSIEELLQGNLGLFVKRELTVA